MGRPRDSSAKLRDRAGLNYFFVRAWSERAIKHFREKHIALRDKMAGGEIPFVGVAP